ncbi:Hint domain-containing protein, partial [Kitasatospora sp. NPDC058965]|uniref:Hint domain-containing protein n=1 Tax=Kitasatospora sp. NPDC058965 TaxID=3346682 RepID=UPI0036BEB84B
NLIKHEATSAAEDLGANAAEDLGTAAAKDSAEETEAIGGSCAIHSFAGDTPVLMADGTTKPISQIKVGDRITNAAPGAGDQKHTVDVVHVTYTDTDFTALTVTTPAGPKTITTTQNHPFYDITTGQFTKAGQLGVGEQLQTTGDGRLTVAGVRNYTDSFVTYDLTIDGLHTYYVLAGTAPVLVHNCGNASTDDLYAAATGNVKGQLSPAGRALQKHGDPSPGNILKRGQAHVDRYDFGRVTNSERTEVGNEIIEEILTHPGATEKLNPSAIAHYGGVTRDIKIPGSWGARWSMRGGSLTFEGFL